MPVRVVDLHHACLPVDVTALHDEENGTLFWWYAAPEGADVDDEELWRACNPTSWLDTRDLRRARAHDRRATSTSPASKTTFCSSPVATR